MSFGWSAGDVASTIQLIHSIVLSLRDTSGAREQFQELETELFGLERALERIDSLARPTNAPPEIQALKFISLYCVETLQRFHKKIKPFEDSLGRHSEMRKLKAAPRMVRWQLLVKKDLPELRQYLMAHAGYLNLELSTASLKSMSRANKHLEQIRSQNDRAVALIVQRIDKSTMSDKGLEEIRQSVDRVWNSNNELANMLRALAEKTTAPPNTRYTWAQEPIYFENALGNTMPIASESDWDILEAIICAQFRKSPGRKKVFAGEFELFDSTASKAFPIDAISCPRLRPGMRITMAIIIGQYSGSQRCPRLGCSSELLSDVDVKGIAGRLCSSCGTWVRKSYKILPKPLRPPTMGNFAFQPPTEGHFPVNADRSGLHLSSTYPERFAYKNISIYVTELPPTPIQFSKPLMCKPRVSQIVEPRFSEPPIWNPRVPHAQFSEPLQYNLDQLASLNLWARHPHQFQDDDIIGGLLLQLDEDEDEEDEEDEEEWPGPVDKLPPHLFSMTGNRPISFLLDESCGRN